MLSRTAVRMVAASALLVVAVSCGRSNAKNSNQVVTRNEEVQAVWTVELVGDLSGKVVNHTAKSRFIMVRTKDEKLKHQQVFGIEPIDPLPLGRAAVRPGFAVNPFNGDGRYTIGAGSVNDAAAEEAKARETGKQRSKSSIQVEWSPTGPGGEMFQYLRRAEPCKVEIRDDGTRGKLSCPSVTEDGVKERFSLVMSWDVV